MWIAGHQRRRRESASGYHLHRQESQVRTPELMCTAIANDPHVSGADRIHQGGGGLRSMKDVSIFVQPRARIQRAPSSTCCVYREAETMVPRAPLAFMIVAIATGHGSWSDACVTTFLAPLRDHATLLSASATPWVILHSPRRCSIGPWRSFARSEQKHGRLCSAESPSSLVPR